MSRQKTAPTLQQICAKCPVIAIVRLDDLTHAVDIAEALYAGGIRALEFTLTNRDAVQAIGAIVTQRDGKDRLKDCLVGAGTVVELSDVDACVAAGADFIVTPVVDTAVIQRANALGCPCVPGAMTPTEILTATRYGATMVKVFPARTLGPAFIKDVLAPLPDSQLMATGGINVDNLSDFMTAGATAVGVGGNLVDAKLIRDARWDKLTERARQYVDVAASTVSA